MVSSILLATSLFAASVLSQQVGTTTPEVHPSLISYQCTKQSGCTQVNTALVLDQTYRTLHKVGSTQKCISGSFDKTICPDVTTCGKNCALEGIDYAAQGIKTSGDAVTLNLYHTVSGTTSEVSPRIYLLANSSSYDMFQLLNREFSFDVDTSKVPCGINGALYLSEMAANGSSSAINTAGAAYGTGYCDAQCPSANFVLGQANLNSNLGSCCAEMDLWEANNAANALTPHPCSVTGPYACTGTACGNGNDKYNGVCDKDGCDYNPYRMGNPNFYGPNKTIDTTKKFSVITQFRTVDGTSTGQLANITRIYVQGTTVVVQPNVNIPGMAVQNAITTDYCTSKIKVLGGTDGFTFEGGMKQMGGAFGRGMVLAMSIWEGGNTGMTWLDGVPSGGNATAPGVKRGDCGNDAGKNYMSLYPDAAVTFSAIKVGEIGSTFTAAAARML